MTCVSFDPIKVPVVSVCMKNKEHFSVLVISRNIFIVRLLSVLRGHSVFSSPPQRPMTSDFSFFLFLHLFSYLNSWERASLFPFECSVLNKSTTGTIFITSLVWRGPWLGIEPGKSRTRSRHYTTRISRRRFKFWHSGINNVTRVYCGLKVLLFSELRLTGAVMLHLTK